MEKMFAYRDWAKLALRLIKVRPGGTHQQAR